MCMPSGQTKTYPLYVTLSHVLRGGRLTPATGVVRQSEVPDWRQLVDSKTLAVWLVDGSTVTHVRDLLLAHLAGNAPAGVTRLYRKTDDH
jgi:hypothetical protein